MCDFFFKVGQVGTQQEGDEDGDGGLEADILAALAASSSTSLADTVDGRQIPSQQSIMSDDGIVRSPMQENGIDSDDES